MLAQRVRGAGLVLAAAALVALSAAGSARADTVTDWNVHAVGALVGTAGQGPTVSTIHLAMVHGAVHDAVSSIDERYEPYLVEVRARDWYSKDAAAATAAYRVLVSILPAQQQALTTLYDNSLATIPAGPAKDGGIRVGGMAAAAMIADRTGDGRPGAYRFPAPASPQDPWQAGQWRPVLPAFGNDPAAWIKDVRPFLIADPHRYGTNGPDAMTSKRYARELEEVRTLGALVSPGRTADQTDMARFWAEGPQPLTRMARQLLASRSHGEADSARVLALFYMTGADALISTWNDKARWLFWRPITAIREADRDGNPATTADTGWLPLINTPPYPDHPSGLSSVGAAMADTLADRFGDRVRVSATSTTSSTTRSWTRLSDVVDEIVDARVYSGIHFRKADEDGERIGERVARYGLERYLERERR